MPDFMPKCDICGNKINELFLGKIEGTYIKKNKKKRAVCRDCQVKFKEEIFDKL